MKKILTIAVAFFLLQACGNTESSGEGGVMDDGMKTVDTNGALNDNGGPLTDSTGNAIENKTRTDIQQRDTSTTPGQ
jgi:hypothetical protein